MSARSNGGGGGGQSGGAASEGWGEGEGASRPARAVRATSEESVTSHNDEQLFARRRARYASLKPKATTDGRTPSPYQPSSPGGGGWGAAGVSEEDRVFGTSSAPGARLARQIRDEFLVCKICLEPYTDPKSLECLHTFCERCIESHMDAEPSYRKYSDYREVSCPLCRKRTPLPTGGVRKLPDSWLVSSLTAVVGRQRPSAAYPVCDVCRTVSRKHREATSKCVDCAKLLCTGCVLVHRDTQVTSAHSVFDIDIEKDIECKEHKDEVVRFYCEKCDACVCVLCTFIAHKDHEITQFSDAVLKYKDTIEGLLARCDEKVAQFDAQIDALARCEDLMRGVEARIHESALQLVTQIRTRERELVDELRGVYGQECLDSADRRKELRHLKENLQSTCSLTHLVLNGQDIELLLLKKDVQDKLRLLSEDSTASSKLPATINKVVEFVAGSADLGFLRETTGDVTKPIVTAARTTKPATTSSSTVSGVKQDSDSAAAAGATRNPPKVAFKVVDLDRLRRSSGDSSESSSSTTTTSEEDTSEASSSSERSATADTAVQTDTRSDVFTADAGVSLPSQRGTMMDVIRMENKFVNTTLSVPPAGAGVVAGAGAGAALQTVSHPGVVVRGRGGITIVSGVIGGAGKIEGAVTKPPPPGGSDSDAGAGGGDDPPGAVRRRLRRDRAQYAGGTGGEEGGGGDLGAPVSMGNMTLEERRRRRMALNRANEDAAAAEVFYDATDGPAATN